MKDRGALFSRDAFCSQKPKLKRKAPENLPKAKTNDLKIFASEMAFMKITGVAVGETRATGGASSG